MKKDYRDMTAQELQEATKEFDVPWTGPGLPGRPLTAKEQADFDAWQAKAKQLRKQRQQSGGTRRVQVSLERSLLARIDAFARYHGMTRASVLAMGGEMFLQASHQPSRG